MSNSPPASTRPNSSDEKDTVVDVPRTQQPAKNAGFFSRKSKDVEVPEKETSDAVVEIPLAEEVLTPASFGSMFRFATKGELLLNFIGLIAAAATGAAQPAMALLFGNLTQQFVIFGTLLAEVAAGGERAVRAAAQIPDAADKFRKVAAEDALYLTIIGIAMFVCTYLYMYIWVYTAEVSSKRLRERYLQAVLRQDIAFFDNVGAGEVATRIQTDTHLVQQGISEKVALVASFLAAFITGFLIAYIKSWRLALAMSSMLPCIAIAGGLMNKFLSRYMQASLQNVAEGGSLAEEVISTIRTAQAFGTQKRLAGLYDNEINKALSNDLKAATAHGIGLSVFFFVIYSCYGLAFHFGTTLIIQGHADAGAVVSVFMSILIGSFSLALLAPEMQAITNGRAAAAKLFATIDRVPLIDSASTTGLKPEHVFGEIVVEHVDFAYPSRPDVRVVKDLSITFPAGKVCALVGASGSGKSTIVSLVERFYDPLDGLVRLDGVDIRELNVKWLRSQIGLVSQEPTLFATTIKGNVAHGLIGTQWENVSDEEKTQLIKDACVKANADDFIMKLPLQYETMVGERGFLLSGGQKQRVAIARAIVSDPRILLLDEATSALDTQSEGIVQDALDKASAGRTTISIAHRLSTIKDADRIFVMGDGLVLESGTHDELLSNTQGPYARLVSTQQLREAREHDATAGAAGDDAEDVQGDVPREDLTLGRRDTQQSLASQVIEAKRNEAKDGKISDLSLPALFGRLYSLNKAGRTKYIVGSIAAIASGAVYPAFGVVYAGGIQSFSAIENSDKRKQAILATIAIGIQNSMFAAAAANLTANLRSSSFRAIVRQDIEFFDKEVNSTGSLTSNLSDNPQKVNGLAGVTLGAIVQSTSTLVLGFAIGLAFNWRIGLIGIACTPVLVSAGYIRLRVVVLKDQKNKLAHEGSAQIACEAAGSIRTVAALTREEDCTRMYSESLEAPLKISNRTAIFSNGLFALSQAIVFFVIALVFWYGSRLVSTQTITVKQFFVGLMSTVFGAIQAGNVFSFVPDISSAKGAGSAIVRLLDSLPEIDAESDEGKRIDATKTQGHIRFENIHFRYPTRPGVRVLRGLSIEVKPGQYIALCGASGSGKSTVIQLIERFYDPLAGEIYLDGELISGLHLNDYRKSIALVSQEPTLYAGTVRFNVLLGAIKPESEVTQEEIEAACRKANILDFILSLPQGFDTAVGGKGSQLSGGQKQRIAIARALLRNPKVLLLDEATSALDSNSEKVVQEALDAAAKGRTTIAIAHRLSTIQNADCIYFVKEGRIAESGTHESLLEKRGDYFEYVQLQRLSKKD